MNNDFLKVVEIFEAEYKKGVPTCTANIDEKIKEFVETQFSKKYKTNLCKFSENDLLDYVLKKAWVDTSMRERMNKGSLVMANKLNILDFLKKEILTNTLVIENFDLWHHATCSLTTYGMRYGLWQKLINMTFKYLFCINRLTKKYCPNYPDGMFHQFNSIWDKCHCPIDSIISKSLYAKLIAYNSTIAPIAPIDLQLVKSISESGAINWNNINSTQYAKYRELMDIICKKESISHLTFDLLYWGIIK